jgi:hypothetical protein
MKLSAVLFFAFGLIISQASFAQTPEQEEKVLRHDAEEAVAQGFDYFVEGALVNPSVVAAPKKGARTPAAIASNGKYFKEGSQPDEALNAELVLDLLNNKK